MPSPFPGMNPFLEQNDTWEDFHLDFITRSREMLAGSVGPNYLVKVEARLYVHELSEEERRFFGKADIGLTTRSSVQSASGVPAATLAAPMSLSLPSVEVRKQPYLEIRDRRNRRLVTVLELLSPANKDPGQDQTAYRSKRAALLVSHTHFVEIDLRRGGQRPQPPVLPACDYYVIVSRYENRPKLGLWPLRLADRLPVIPIPLTAPDADAPLDLQEALNKTYDAADYGKYIYTEAPEPPLSPEDAAWAMQFVPHREAREDAEQ
ncbi:MAG: DUF4058 family protein [Planctomycetes bacterium]|nr:DUF4058 family protein [Planctomycetota bacterium]